MLEISCWIEHLLSLPLSDGQLVHSVAWVGVKGWIPCEFPPPNIMAVCVCVLMLPSGRRLWWVCYFTTAMDKPFSTQLGLFACACKRNDAFLSVLQYSSHTICILGCVHICTIFSPCKQKPVALWVFFFFLVFFFLDVVCVGRWEHSNHTRLRFQSNSSTVRLL